MNWCSTSSGCDIEFSLKNNLRQGVKNINTIIFLYDIDNEMLGWGYETYFDGYNSCLPAKFSTRASVHLPNDAKNYLFETGAVGKENFKDILNFYEFRIIDYEICD